MRKNKILLTILALTLGISTSGFATQTNDAPKTTPTKTTTSKTTTSKPKTTATPKKATTNTPKVTTTKPKTNSKVVTNFNCAGQIIKVEYDGEIAKLTNKDGVYTLKVAKAASGALYTNSKAIEIGDRLDENGNVNLFNGARIISDKGLMTNLQFQGVSKTFDKSSGIQS